MNLCINCLETGGQPREIGPQGGTQRDPERRTISLCAACWEPLYTGDLAAFNARYTGTRTITR